MTDRSVVPLVREATAADVEAIVDIYLANARHHAALAPDAYRVPQREAVLDRFSRMLDERDDEDAHFVAEVDGRVVGALDAFRRPDGSPGAMRIPRRTAAFGIGVLEGWRGRGIGSALIERAETWARAEGLDALVLDVASENEGARGLYERMGYVPVSDHLGKPLGGS